MMTGSEPNYIEHLDKLSALIEKYEVTHNIVIVGDLNGSLRDITNVVFVRTGTCAEPFS
jgi:hypothetical protein